MRKLVFAFLLLVFPLCHAATESLRGPVVAVLEPGSSSNQASFAAGDLVVIGPGSADMMSAAIKVEIGIPAPVRDYRGAYAVYLYSRVSPSPSFENKNYRVQAVEFLLLPPSSRFTLYLPLSADFVTEESFDISLVDTVLNKKDFPLILAILPVMKGLPSEISETVFDVEVTFAPASLGVLRYNLIFPGEDHLPYSVAVDGVSKRGAGQEIPLTEGLHNLSITSPHYVDKTVTFSIEAGSYTDLDVALEAKASRVITEVPEGTRIFLDGAPIEITDPAGLEIEPGEHTVVFKIGDYSLTKSFSVLPGTACTLSVDMEINVKID